MHDEATAHTLAFYPSWTILMSATAATPANGACLHIFFASCSAVDANQSSRYTCLGFNRRRFAYKVDWLTAELAGLKSANGYYDPRNISFYYVSFVIFSVAYGGLRQVFPYNSSPTLCINLRLLASNITN